jgi:RNA ligase (TIGR02306 family)
LSKTAITIERINSVEPHPNADRLEVVQVLGYTVVVRKGMFKVGDAGTYFPPDMLISEHIADSLGVKQYLKHSVYPGDGMKTQCRISACRLRGVPSFGFLTGPITEPCFGMDVTEQYEGKKYFPPARVLGGDCLPPDDRFHEYTSIENIRNFPDLFQDEQVRITEKIHGTNVRIGHIGKDFMAGSHHTRRVQGDPLTMYWQPYPIVADMLMYLSSLWGADVIVFGEIFGQGVQDMDYGQPVPGFRAFDMSVDGRYLSDVDFRFWTGRYKVPIVNSLYCGSFNKGIVDAATNGPTTMKIDDKIRCKFKGREGIVIKPLSEQHSDVLGGRLILKSVSVDYYERKGAKDLG